MFEILGIVGIATSVAAYVPKVIHLGREHCSAGVSSKGSGRPQLPEASRNSLFSARYADGDSRCRTTNPAEG